MILLLLLVINVGKYPGLQDAQKMANLKDVVIVGNWVMLSVESPFMVFILITPSPQFSGKFLNFEEFPKFPY